MAINLDYTNKTIEVTSAYSMVAFYSSLMGTFYEQVQMDDDEPIKYNTPDEYELIYGWEFLNDTSVQFLSGGSVIVNKTGGNDVWANIYTLGAIETGTHMYVVQNGSKITDFWADGHIDILVKVTAAGVDIDNRDLTIFAREWGDKFDNLSITPPATGGRNPVPLATESDINNSTSVTTIEALSGLTITFGTISRDIGNGNGFVNYDVEIDCGGEVLSNVYEWLKYKTYASSTGTLNTINSYAYVSANTSYSEVKAAPFGLYAGGTFFGARGVWITNYDAGDANNFQLIDATGTTQAPPVTVPISVSSLLAEDRVGVYRLTGVGGTINKTEYTVSGAHLSTDTTLTVNTTITSDTPPDGVVRVGDNRHIYTSFTGSVFTVPATLGVAYVGGESSYVPFIDEESTGISVSTSITYSTSVPVKVVVRAYKILPFEVETTISSSGLSVSAIRTEDTVVT